MSEILDPRTHSPLPSRMLRADLSTLTERWMDVYLDALVAWRDEEVDDRWETEEACYLWYKGFCGGYFSGLSIGDISRLYSGIPYDFAAHSALDVDRVGSASILAGTGLIRDVYELDYMHGVSEIETYHGDLATIRGDLMEELRFDLERSECESYLLSMYGLVSKHAALAERRHFYRLTTRGITYRGFR